MATKLSPFPLIRATATLLQGSLAAKIAAFNAEPANQVDLTVVANANYYPGGTDVGVYPRIELHVPRAALGRASIGNDERDLDQRLVIVIWDEATTGEIPELYEKLAGYVRCILEVILQEDVLGDGVEIADQADAVVVEYSVLPDAPTDESRTIEKWRGAALVVLELEDVAHIQ